MSITPPLPGQDPWGEDLNAYLASLETRISDLENKADYIFNSYPWQFSNLAPPATGNQVRLNNVQGSLATLIDIRRIDSDGADRTVVLGQLGLGAYVRINDWDDSNNLYRYQVTGAPTSNSTNFMIPVAWVSGGGVVPNAKANVAFLVPIPG